MLEFVWHFHLPEYSQESYKKMTHKLDRPSEISKMDLCTPGSATDVTDCPLDNDKLGNSLPAMQDRPLRP